jgi:hypothetical protein
MSNVRLMFPVPSLASQIEQEWSEELAARFGCPLEAFRAMPTRHMQYPHDTARIDLMDGSHVQFRNAFFIARPQKKTVAVFTEHCGHHVLPFHEARVFCNGELRYEQQSA